MQTNEIGSNHSDLHHVTNCIHNHKHRLEGKVGGAGGAGTNTSQPVTPTVQQVEEPLSLSVWLQNTLSNAKKVLGRIWGSDGDAAGNVVAKTGVESVINIATQNGADVTLSALNMQPVQGVNNNPYFAALTEESIPQQTIWQKIKIRFQNITGFLAKRFSFAGGGTFQTKQERPKEDLRRHSRYRKDDVEIDCVLTDESYLMDSYNKKGEYSKLSAEK